MSKILLLGHAQHGKGTVAKMMNEIFGLTSKSSSIAASELFIYDALKGKYGYTSPEQCFEDRVNHRSEWYNLICEYNKNDKARLAKDILKDNDIYDGMRDNGELIASKPLFDWIIGVYNPHKPLEPATSFNIDMWQHSDIILSNAGTLEDLRSKVEKLPLATNEEDEGWMERYVNVCNTSLSSLTFINTHDFPSLKKPKEKLILKNMDVIEYVTKYAHRQCYGE